MFSQNSIIININIFLYIFLTIKESLILISNKQKCARVALKHFSPGEISVALIYIFKPLISIKFQIFRGETPRPPPEFIIVNHNYSFIHYYYIMINYCY